jgi:hypothetical protein
MSLELANLFLKINPILKLLSYKCIHVEIFEHKF